MAVSNKALVALAGVFLGLGGAGTALAGAGDSNPPEQVYAGPVLGYDNVVESDLGSGVNRGGLSYGGLAGIDTPVGAHGRVGLEAQVMGSTAALTSVTGSSVQKVAAGVDLFFGGKLGWMVTPRTQLFTRVGYAYSRFTVSDSENGVKVLQLADNLSGFRVGGGAEYLLSKNIRARLEYNYTHYGEVKYQGADLGFKLERHQVTAGLLYGF